MESGAGLAAPGFLPAVAAGLRERLFFMGGPRYHMDAQRSDAAVVRSDRTLQDEVMVVVRADAEFARAHA